MANNTWTGSGGNLTSTWDTGSNWSRSNVPASNDAVFINVAGTVPYTVTENTSGNIAGLTIGSANATLSFTGVTLGVSGTTTLSNGTITFANAAAALNTATFQQSGGTFSASEGQLNVSGGGTGLAVTGGTFSLSGGAVTVTNAASFTGGSDTISGGKFKASQLTIGGTSTVLTLSGGTVTTTVNSDNASRIDSGDTVRMSGNAVLDFTNAGANTTAGLRDSGALIGAGTVKGVLSNGGSGVVEANGGTLDLTSNIAAGTGLAFKIGTTGVMQVDGTLGANNTFTYLGASGELAYNNATKGIVETLVGLTVGSSATLPTNFIHFERYTVTVSGSKTHSGSSATVNLSDGSVLSLSGITNATPTWFVNTVSDGTAGTDVFLSSVCYAAGTHILTATGERLIEHLMPGDIVLTLTDSGMSAQPVRWIGRRRLDLRAHPRPETVAPVRIRRGAFADTMPHADLLVSPDHAIYVDGKLVCARQLINRMTIRQETGWTSVEYFHIELDAHAILIADGLPAESYLNTGNRGFFANSGAPLDLHPDLTDATDYPTREAGSCVPFVWDAASVRPVWQRLADRATRIAGPQPALDTTADAGLHIVVDGRTVTPIRGEDRQYIFALPDGTREVRLVSRAGSPTDTRPWLEDRRRLGVYVERIVLRGANERREVWVDNPSLSQGWWPVEHDGATARRWTDGDALLPLPYCTGPTTLVIYASSSEMTYLSNTEPRRHAA